MILENVVQALGTLASDDVVKSMIVTQPVIVPVLLLVTFEITYLVHKRRSVKFCGISFDEKGRRNKNTFRSWVLRNLVNMLSLTMISVGVVVEFDLLALENVDEDAGKVGWFDLFEFEGNWEEQTHKVLALLPTALLVLFNLYFAVMMWRYGTLSSMIIHSSYCNPWISQFIGTLALAAGQVFSEKFFSVMSNAGEVIMIIMTILLMSLVDKDMSEASAFDTFLDVIGNKTATKEEDAAVKIALESLRKSVKFDDMLAASGSSSKSSIQFGSVNGSSVSGDRMGNGGRSFGSGITVDSSKHNSVKSNASSASGGGEEEYDGGILQNIWSAIFPQTPVKKGGRSSDEELVWGPEGERGIVELKDVQVRL
jgi:hypothetical protein